MELGKRKEYLSRLLVDAQRARSIILESQGEDEATLSVLVDLEPWLFGKRCIVEALARCIDGEPEDIDVINFASIARMSAALQIQAAISKRRDPQTEEVFA